jgi:hypothetical protein
MTTIAANCEVMACDSQAATDAVKTSVQKIWRIKGWLVGAAGTYAQVLEGVAAIKRHKDMTPKQVLEDVELGIPGVNLLLLSPDGKLYESEGGARPHLLQEGYGAIGTGSQGAMVAFILGATPTQAIRAVRRVDPHTGGRTVTKRPTKRKDHA